MRNRCDTGNVTVPVLMSERRDENVSLVEYLASIGRSTRGENIPSHIFLLG